MEGTFKGWTKGRLFGFIRVDDGSPDAFLHQSEVGNPAVLRPGARIEFTLSQTEKGPSASNVKVLSPGVATAGTGSMEGWSNRKSGIVKALRDDFGFISCSEYPGHDIYFKKAWFTGFSSVKEGEAVAFNLKAYGDSLTARSVGRITNLATEAPVSDVIFDWAYLGHLPDVLSELKKKALDEEWWFKDSPRDPDRPFPILFSYLVNTFGRLALEGKIMTNGAASLAALNTGLVDYRYEPIYALFGRHTGPQPWRLVEFCIAGEHSSGQNLVRHFSPLPAGPHYFDNPADLLYDSRVGKLEPFWDHVIVDNIDRYPTEFLRAHWPTGFPELETAPTSWEGRKAYFDRLGTAIKADAGCYRQIINRVKDAINLSIKRVSWNFKTAVPQYYPVVRQLQLLLPLCLISDDRVDLALAVEKTPSGNYLGHTVLRLDWAYRNARLVCRPDSDWLDQKKISQLSDEDEPDE